MRLLTVLALTLFGCRQSEPFWQQTEGGTYYHIYEAGEGASLQLRDQLKFHLSIMKSSDSTEVFDSKSKVEALEFEYSSVLFNGAFREVLPLVQVGDSVLIKMPAAQFYGKSFPDELNKEDTIECAVKFLEILPSKNKKHNI